MKEENSDCHSKVIHVLRKTFAVSRCLPSHLNTVSSVDSCVKEFFNYFLSYGYMLFMFSVKFDIERISTLNYNL